MLSSAEDIRENFDDRLKPIVEEVERWTARERDLRERFRRASDDITKYGKLVADAEKAAVNDKLIARPSRRKETKEEKLARLKAEVAALQEELGD
jgi:predicted RNase H-like nuclease (RuvC/YqgF family)